MLIIFDMERKMPIVILNLCFKLFVETDREIGVNFFDKNLRNLKTIEKHLTVPMIGCVIRISITNGFTHNFQLSFFKLNGIRKVFATPCISTFLTPFLFFAITCIFRKFTDVIK